MANEERTRLRCFLAIPYSLQFESVRKAVVKGAQLARFKTITTREEGYLPGMDRDATVGGLARADCVLADLTNRNENVFFEIGAAQAMGKRLFLIVERRYKREIPRTFQRHQVLIYEQTKEGLANLSNIVRNTLLDYRRSPAQTRLFPSPRYATPFFVDWDRLESSEAENLCRELLAQLGYRQIEWDKKSRAFDLIAELPKKDPDGFEYRELWLVVMGRKAPVRMILDMVVHEPEYLLNSLMVYNERGERTISRHAWTAPVTVLFIVLEGEVPGEMLERLRLVNDRGRIEGRYTVNVRFRVWDRDYLTSLVQQFPQIGYKYFSDEARAQSKYRKTPEELYKEYAELSERQAATLARLKEEKDKRISAERDAMWKDISFSAAHKIGNPIFAIETNLDPLERRVAENRTTEAGEVIKNMRTSVEKAKAIVDQFKSLTRAQEINAVETRLFPILEDACKLAKNQDVTCEIHCDPKLVVQADPDRLAECFDELASNATHWLDKIEKKIEAKVSVPERSRLPEFVDSRRKYALIHFSDNGTGVSLKNKNKIFDAFFTTHDQGTGLGLALVRRIVEGHGGAIVETGHPGKGADFEVYLPLAGAKTRTRIDDKVKKGKRTVPKKRKVLKKKKKKE